MTQLTAAATAITTTLRVNEAPPAPGTYFTVDDEAIRVLGATNEFPGPQLIWLVERAVGGTTAATHESGATLTRYYPDAAAVGGSSLSADITAALEGALTPLTAENPAASVADVPLVVTRTLTAEEILLLGDEPLDLVPGEPGKVLIPIWASGVLRYNTSTYITTDIGTFSIGPQAQSIGACITLPGESAIGTTADRIFSSPGAEFPSIYDGTAVGEPLQICLSANPSAGDSPIDITVVYRVVSVAP